MDFTNIKDIEIEYKYLYPLHISNYVLADVENNITLSPDKNTIRFIIKNSSQINENKIYQLIIKKNGEHINIKGDFFSKPEIQYPTTITIYNDCMILTSNDSHEQMTIQVYIE